MANHQMLRELLDQMPVAPFDKASLPAAEKKSMETIETALNECVHNGIQPITMMRLTAFLCIICDRSGLSLEQIQSQHCQERMLRRAFVRNFPVSDDEITEVINELRALYDLPPLL